MEKKAIPHREMIEVLMSEWHADWYEEGPEWNGYRVFCPRRNRKVYIGSPTYVLVKGDEVRFTEHDEGLEYCHYMSELKKRKNNNSN